MDIFNFDPKMVLSFYLTLFRISVVLFVMDGAGKFVQGDVKAGLILLFINIIGGFFIGVLQKGMARLTELPVSALSFGPGLKNSIAPASSDLLWRLIFKHALPGQITGQAAA